MMLHSGILIEPTFSIQLNLQDLPAVLAVSAAAVAVQILLSRREPWWPGLILPIVCCLGLALGIVPQAAALRTGGASWQDTLGAAAKALLIENTATALLLAVYAVCRLLRRQKRRRQLRKTRIDDL